MLELFNVAGKTTAPPPFDIQAKANLGLAIAAIALVLPFIINHIIHGRYLMSAVSFSVAAGLAINGYTIFRSYHYPLLNLLCLIPATVVFLLASFFTQGVIASYWSYPGILVCYFMLPERQAWIGNLILLSVILPCCWILLEPHMAMRATATLIGVSIFTFIFVRIINLQQKELEHQEEQRREGMASVSHELRTPMATLLAQIVAMRDGIRSRDDKQLDILSRSVDHLNELIDDLYQLALADVGALKIRSEPQNWNSIVEEAVEAAQNKMNVRGLTMISELEHDVLVSGDKKRLQQIVNNLLQNCYRYCSENGEISISLKKKSGQAELLISDNGPGVSDQALSSLFDRFYRAEGSRSRETGGAGLGLALVKALTEAHRGSASAFHTASGGLGIRISIPSITQHRSGGAA